MEYRSNKEVQEMAWLLKDLNEIADAEAVMKSIEIKKYKPDTFILAMLRGHSYRENIELLDSIKRLLGEYSINSTSTAEQFKTAYDKQRGGQVGE